MKKEEEEEEEEGKRKEKKRKERWGQANEMAHQCLFDMSTKKGAGSGQLGKTSRKLIIVGIRKIIQRQLARPKPLNKKW